MFKEAIRIIDVNIGLISNNQDFVRAEEYLDAATQAKNPQIWSILTALPAPISIPYEEEKMDAFFYVIDMPSAKPSIMVEGNRCVLIGNFSEYERSVKDLRWNIYGNVGLFFAFALTVLERSASIHSMHASALYNEKENLLLIVAGSSGSGKTVLQLEALLNHDYKVFTTEMTHFRVHEGGCTFFKGSTYDNIRIGNLVYDFPEAIERFNISVPEVEDKWETYLAVDFRPWSSKQDVLENPRVVIMFPRIETGRTEIVLDGKGSYSSFVKSTFDNASEKIYKSQIMYGGYPCFASFDTQALADQRLEDVRKLLKMDNVTDRIRILASPKDCWAWEDLIKHKLDK